MRKSALFGLLLLSTSPFLLRCGGSDDDATAPPATIAAADASQPAEDASVADTAPAVDAAPKLPTRSAGCGMAATASGTAGDMKTVKSGGVDRSFVLYVPKGYDPNRNYPVVVLFHGIDSTGTDMANYIQMQDYAAGDAIVAFPTAIDGWWDIDGSKGERDLPFFDALMNSVESTLCVNEQRVFALGFSLGAYMANHLACHRSETVRAFVAADGSFTDSPSDCGSTATLNYHRTDDDNEAISGGRAARDKWLTINGCKSTTTAVTDFGFGGLGCVQYDGCTQIWCEDTDTSPPDYKHNLRDVYRVPMWNWFNHFQ